MCLRNSIIDIMKKVKTVYLKASTIAMMLFAGIIANAQNVQPTIKDEAVKDVAQEVKKDNSMDWASKIKLYGDIRLRFDSESAERNVSKKRVRDRERVRARLNMDANLGDEWMGSIQLSTAPDDPTSGNQTLGQGFTGKSYGLERAYLRYTPEFAGKAVKLYGGKIAQPWISVSDLIYDSSVNPEGVAVVGEYKINNITLFANGGLFQIADTLNDTVSNNKSNPVRLYSGQAALKVEMSDDVSLLMGASLYFWDNLTGKNPRTGLWNQGEACGINNGGADYDVNTYEEVELFASLDMGVNVFNMNIPCSLFGQYVSNSKGELDKDGYLVGTKVGKADKGKIEVVYDYRNLGRDAVISSYPEGSVWGGGTDGKGHRVQVKYGLTKSVQLGLTGFLAKADISDTQTADSANSGDYKRVQFDIAAKF